MFCFLEYPDSGILMASTLYVQSHALSPSSPDRIPLGCQYFPTTELDLPCPCWAGFSVFNTLPHPTPPHRGLTFTFLIHLVGLLAFALLSKLCPFTDTLFPYPHFQFAHLSENLSFLPSFLPFSLSFWLHHVDCGISVSQPGTELW